MRIEPSNPSSPKYPRLAAAAVAVTLAAATSSCQQQQQQQQTPPGGMAPWPQVMGGVLE